MKNIFKSLRHPDVIWVVSLVIVVTAVLERIKNDAAVHPLLAILSIPAVIYLMMGITNVGGRKKKR